VIKHVKTRHLAGFLSAIFSVMRQIRKTITAVPFKKSRVRLNTSPDESKTLFFMIQLKKIRNNFINLQYNTIYGIGIATLM
jgi:hypothetical protein